jgi:hypothetical protein
VKWFKKLKFVQKDLTLNRQNKEFQKIKIEVNPNNRIKLLEDMNAELWKCHA